MSDLFTAMNDVRLANMGVEIEYIVSKAMLRMFLELPDGISRKKLRLMVEEALSSYVATGKVVNVICSGYNNSVETIQEGNCILDIEMEGGTLWHFNLRDIILKYKTMVTI